MNLATPRYDRMNDSAASLVQDGKAMSGDE